MNRWIVYRELAQPQIRELERRKEEFRPNQLYEGSKNEPRGNLKVKKCKPLEAREFVDFTNFSSLTLKYVKQACEDHCNQLIGSCNVLYSDRGSSCVEDSQIAGPKLFLIRLLESNNYARTNIPNQRIVPSKKIKLTTTQPLSNIPKNTPSYSTTYPKSSSVVDLLHAGRIIRPKEEIEVLLVLNLLIYIYLYIRNNGLKWTHEGSM